MKILKIWYFVCWVFGFNSLNTLVEESHEVVYAKRNETEEVQRLICEKLTLLDLNKTIDLERLRDDLYRHFNSSYRYYNARRVYPNRFKESVLSLMKSGTYLILNQRICFITNDKKN